jgi:putative hydrolase of the HAD superfamily
MMPLGTRTFGDESCIAELPTTNILVTMGYTEVQEKKIEAIGIAKYFQKVVVDEIDLPTRKGKKAIFAELLQENGWDPGEVLAVGDNPASELLAAHELGILAVQTVRPSIDAWEGADYRITSLCELKSIVESLRTA